MLTRRPQSLVGLDIGSHSVKAVQLRPAGDRHTVAAAGLEPVPRDSIVDGAIVDGDAVAEAIRQLFGRQPIKTREVAVALAGNAVIVKKISLPAMAPAELAESIRWEARQHIPFDLADVSLDYQVLDSRDQAEDERTREVVMVAAKKETIAAYTGTIAQAGCVPVVVDVAAFALQNAYELSHGSEADDVVALLNAGAGAVNINVLDGDRSIFSRDLAIGGNAYTEALQKELNLPFHEAERLKKGIPVDGQTYEDAEPVIRAVTENLLMEISKTVDFFRATVPARRVDRIVLSGGTSQVEGFAEALAERFDVQVERLDPFRGLPSDRAAAEVVAEAGPVAAIAVGLALRRADDR